jgi:hypothetical protein
LLSIALRTSWKGLWRVFALLMIVGMVPLEAAYAQTTGTLRGTVFDEDDLEMPNVSITITSPNLIGGKRESETDGSGRFSFLELLPGPYSITAVYEGYPAVTVQGVQVNINRTTTQNINMIPGDDAEVVDVVARQTVDTEDTTVGQVLTKDFLRNIPAGRSYQQVVQTTAGVSGGSNPNVGGGASNENTYLLDGATVTDPVTGTFGNNFNFDAIQQIEVLTAGVEPEYGTSLGGIINIVTESGTNNLQFDTSVFYQNGNWRPRKDERWTADGFQLGPTGFDTQLGILNISSKISGPLVRDKAWFLFSYSYVWNRQSLAGVRQPVDIHAHQLLGKLTIQPNSAHRITLLYQTDPDTFDNIAQRGPFQRAESEARQTQAGFVSQLRWQWFLNEDVNLDTRVSAQRININLTGVPCTHDRNRDEHQCRAGEQQGEVDYFTPGRSGAFGAYDSVNWPFFNLSDRWRFSAGTKLAVFGIEDPLGGTHDFKVGVEGNQFLDNNIIGYHGNSLYTDANLAAFDPETLVNFNFIESSQPILQRGSGSTWNFFIQDFYKPISNLTIKYGVRFDSSVFRNDVGDPVINGNLWGPRLFVSWDPFGDQKTKFAAGYGRFNDTARAALSSYTNIGSFGFKFYFGEIGGNFTSRQEELANVQPRDNPNTANDQLRLPTLDQFLFKFQRQIVPDLSVGVDFTANFTRHLYNGDETSVIYDEDGTGVIGSRRSNPLIQYLRLRTPRISSRNYYRGDIYIEKQFNRRYFLRANYSLSFINGTTNRSLQGTFENDPQTRYIYGPLLTAQTHMVDIAAFWQLPTDPWTTTMGMWFDYESGLPIERFYWSDEFVSFGSYVGRIRQRSGYTRFNDVWSLNLQFSQQFDVRKGAIRLDVILQNITNNRAPTSYQFGQFYATNRLFVTNRQLPLTLLIGLRYEF